MMMFYSPIAGLYFKHQRHIHDLLVYGAIYLVVFYFDATANLAGFNLAPFTLPLFGFFYIAANYLVKAYQKSDLFKMFGNHSHTYCLLMAVFSWLAYSFYLRPKMLTGN